MEIVSEDEGISFCEIQTLFLLQGLMCTGHDDKIYLLHGRLGIFVYILAFNLFLPKTSTIYFHWQPNMLTCRFFCNLLITENSTTKFSQNVGCQSPSTTVPHPTRIKTSQVQWCKILQIHTISCALKDPTICSSKANEHKFLCNTPLSTNSTFSLYKYYSCTATTRNTVLSIPIFKIQYCPKSTVTLWYTYTYVYL